MPRKVPLRKCVGCQEMKGKRDLLRIVATGDGEVGFDPTGKRAGRGAYVCPKRSCLELAHRKKALERALKREVSETIYAQLNAQLEEVSDGE